MVATNIIDKIQITNASVERLSESTVHLKWRKGADLEVKDIDEMHVAFKQITNGQQVKVVSEFEPFVSITSEAREYAASTSPDLIALAYVIHSLSQRIIIRFYIKMKKKKHPTKVFDSFDQAVNWLDNC